MSDDRVYVDVADIPLSRRMNHTAVFPESIHHVPEIDCIATDEEQTGHEIIWFLFKI